MNETGYSDSLSGIVPLMWLLSITSPANGFTGFDIAAILAEETIDGAKAAPGNLIKTVVFSGVGSVLLIISMVFACRNNIDGILGGPTIYPAVNLFALAFTKNSDVNNPST